MYTDVANYRITINQPTATYCDLSTYSIRLTNMLQVVLLQHACTAADTSTRKPEQGYYFHCKLLQFSHRWG